jgi:galactokinase/mevalonate kinase-like predicted kinase
MICASAPGRAGIIGNPTDGYGGTLISCAIDRRATVTLSEAEKTVIENEGLQCALHIPDDYRNRGDVFDIAKSVLRFFNLYDRKLHITIATDIPKQAGLAGSTAVLSALLRAVMAYLNIEINNYMFAEINRSVELNHMKMQCGYQDAYMTTFGGLNYLDFRGKEHYREWDEEDYGTVEPLGERVGRLPFVIAHTGVSHVSGDVHRPLRERWMEGDLAVMSAYNRITAIAREGKKALLEENWEHLAELMKENHELQDRLSPSGPEVSRLISAAMSAGAPAAKLAGAGGGGTVIALTFDADKTVAAMTQAGAAEFVKLAPLAEGATLAGKDIDCSIFSASG